MTSVLEERLQQQLQLFEAISTTTPDFIYVFDRQGRFVYANRRLLEVWGRSADQAIGRNLYELGYPTWHADMHMREIAAVLETKRPIKGEVPFTGGSGISGVYEYIFSPVLGSDGQVTWIAGTTRDVTERRNVELDRERLAGQLQLALDAAKMGWWHFDPQTGVTSYDKRFSEIFGITGSRQPETDLQGRIHPDDLPDVQDQAKAALDPLNPKPFSIQYRVVHDDGSVRWVEAYGTASFEGEGERRRVTSFVGTVADVTDRIREAEQSRTILESVTDAFFAVDRNWRFTYANPQAERVLNRQPNELLGKVMWEDYPALIGSEFEKTYRRTATERVAHSVTSFYPEHDRWYEVHAYPGADDGISVYFRDVTERVRSEEQLRRSHDTFYNLIQNNPFGVYVVDADFRLREVSLGSQKVFASVEPLLGRDFAEVLRIVWAEPFATEAIERFRHTLTTGESYASPSTTERRQDLDDVEAYDWRIERITLPDGRYGVVCYFYDLSQRKALEHALHVSEDRLQLAVAIAQIGTFDIDLRTDAVAVNETGRQIYGWGPSEELTFSKVQSQFHPDDKEEVLRKVAEAFQPNGPGEFAIEQRIFHRNGDVRWIRVRGRAFFDMVGEQLQAVRCVGTYVDTTADKEAEHQREVLLAGERAARAEAERAGRMKDEFLATLSHELRTPLNAIIGWSQILMRGATDREDLERGLTTIERNARSQAQIIEDLLDMSGIISGKIRLDVQRLDLAAVIRAAIETVQPAATAKGVRLQVVLDPFTGPVTGDPNRLQQVFWNLLSNAVKFTPKEGRVQVLLERVNSHLEVSVIDTGEGIAPEFLPHVFDRFRQADASSTRRHGGLGLGLAIVKQLVELHGGSVRAKSGGQGVGSTFIVALPLTPIHLESSTVELRRHPDAGSSLSLGNDCARINGVRVLVVDDEPDARALVKRLLEECGAHVTMAASASEALQRVQADRPDVLVSDIGMPGEDGYTLIRKVRSLSADQGGNIPAVALTAYARSEDRIKTISAGYQHHVVKPVEPAELITMVASLARREET